MKLHRSTAQAVIDALGLIFVDRKYADKVIEKVLKQNPKWGARDRKFIAATTYDIVRWHRWLLAITDASPSDFWKVLGAYLVTHQIALPDWPEFSGVQQQAILERSKKTTARKIRHSYPDWLDELAEKELGEEIWSREAAALNEEAPVVLRVNTLKTTQQQLSELLAAQGVGTRHLQVFPDALVLEDRQNVFRLPAFKEGLFEVQDAASQLVAPFLEVGPGMRVIDACAGAGGKTLHLASLMKNKGRIVAMDVEAWKLEELQKRARRAGVSNLEARLIDSSKTIKRLENSADRLLLDVPCSGLGVLKRNPDAKWKLSPEVVANVKKLQEKILEEYSVMLKTGGMVVYATCSILPSECEDQVKKFLEKMAGSFELLEEKRTWPSEGFDGFYMARLKKVR